MKVVFFDGYCNLCNGLAEWLIRVDKKKCLRFASLQGETARAHLGGFKDELPTDPTTIVYLREGLKFERSSAILTLLSDLGGIWLFAKVFWIVPKYFRDWIYGIVAKNRYKIFGKRDTCRLPSKEESERILP